MWLYTSEAFWEECSLITLTAASVINSPCCLFRGCQFRGFFCDASVTFHCDTVGSGFRDLAKTSHYFGFKQYCLELISYLTTIQILHAVVVGRI